MNRIKNNIKAIVGLLIVWFAMSSCEELRFGNDFLDQQPEQIGLTVDTIFDSQYFANQVLTKAYTSLPYPIPYGNNYAMGGDLLESITDHSYSICHYAAGQSQYYIGVYNSTTEMKNQKYYFSRPSVWEGIRKAWLMVEHVDKVPDMSDGEKARAKAEAKMIVATHYVDMLRHLGGVPIIDHAVDVNEVMHYPRATVENTVNFIVELIDESKNDLEWKVSNTADDGRMTKGYALGLKLRTLLFAASPLFNSATPYMDGEASTKKLTWYGNYDANRWEQARLAGQEFFDALSAEGGYELIQATEATEEAYRKAYNDAYFTRGNTEVLLSIRTGYKNNYNNRFTGGADNFARCQNPTLKYVNLFPYADGSDFPKDFDWSNVQTDPYVGRDPRFYETVLTSGRPYAGATSELFVGGNHRKEATSIGTGFLMYKFSQDYTSATAVGAVDNYPHLRLAEVYLSYAEAINEAKGGPDAKAYECVNTVRSRVGLSPLSPGLDQAAFRKAILKERACELGYEGCHWFDIVRWKDEAAFKDDIQGINQFIDASKPTGYRYEVFTIAPERHWKTNWSPKWYLSAFPKVDLEKDYGIIQNPGW